jgi:hypothetical protein
MLPWLSLDGVGFSEVSQPLYHRALAKHFPVWRGRIVSSVSPQLAAAKTDQLQEYPSIITTLTKRIYGGVQSSCMRNSHDRRNGKSVRKGLPEKVDS